MAFIHLHTQPTTLPCFAIRVRTRGEEYVASRLRQKGFHVLSPTFTELRHYSDRASRVRFALFPGYVFVRMQIADRHHVLATDGVSYIVRTGPDFEPLSDEETTAVEALCRITETCEPCSYLRLGQRVQVESGPFSGVRGVLVSVRDSRRLVITVDSLRSSVSFEVGSHRIRVIDDISEHITAEIASRSVAAASLT